MTNETPTLLAELLNRCAKTYRSKGKYGVANTFEVCAGGITNAAPRWSAHEMASLVSLWRAKARILVEYKAKVIAETYKACADLVEAQVSAAVH